MLCSDLLGCRAALAAEVKAGSLLPGGSGAQLVSKDEGIWVNHLPGPIKV